MRSALHLLPAFLFPIASLACRQGGGLTKFDAVPDPAISSPADGSTLIEGALVTLYGSASDPDDDTADLTVRWFVNDTEVCASAALDDLGGTSCDTVVPGTATMEIRLDATDPGDSTGSAYASVTVTPNAGPVVTIQSPEAGLVYYADELLTFRGTVSDSETSAEDLTAWWQEDAVVLDVEGVPTTEGEVVGYGALEQGTHALELHALDAEGNEGFATVVVEVGPPNSAPACAITAPTSGDVGESGRLVTFQGTVSDADIAADQLTVSWESDKDGALGASSPTSAGDVTLPINSLSVDTHVITLRVADELGATCTTDVVYTVGTAPTITVEAPFDGEVFGEGDLVTFTALVADTEDVASDLTVTWESSLDGLFHEGPPDSSGVSQLQTDVLSPGEHGLTVTVTDSSGLYATALSTFVVDGVPTAPGVSITPTSPLTDDDLVVSIDSPSVDPEGDALTYSYAWTLNGVPSSASTSATLTDAETEHGDVWSVDVRANDGYVDSAVGTASVTIGDTVPSISAVTISPASPTPTSTLTCGWSGWSDNDGDVDQSTIAWTIDGVASGTGTTLPGPFDAGSNVTCTVTPFDGFSAGTALSDTVTITNTPPVVSTVTLAPDPAFTDDTLAVVVSSYDADGDALSVTYTWYVNGTLIAATGSTLDGSWFDRDDDVYVVVEADDGIAVDSLASTVVTIQNTAPELASVEFFSAGPPARNTELTCIGEGSDADGDAVSVTYAWDVDGVPAGSSSSLSGPFAIGALVTCTVTPDDGTDTGVPMSASVTIGNTAPSCSGLELPRNVQTNDTLAIAWVFFVNDYDGDPLTVSYTWFVNGVAVSATGSTLDGVLYFDRDDTVYLVVTGDDGAETCTSTSNTITIIDTPPTAPVVEITPDDAMAGDDLTCSVVTDSVDVDGDPLVYNFAWDVDGLDYGSAADGSTSSVVSGVDVDWNQNWTCSVRADGGSPSIGVGTDTVTTAHCPLGSSADCPATDCTAILDAGDSLGDGNYLLDLGTYWCDMTTDGGGWTLVHDNAPVYGTTWDSTYYNTEGFTWTETLFAYDSGSASAHCTYPDSLTGCNNLGFQFASESWGVPLNWGSSTCGMATTDYSTATTYPGGYDFIVARGESTATIRLGSLEGISSCTTSDNSGTAYVDVLVRR